MFLQMAQMAKGVTLIDNRGMKMKMNVDTDIDNNEPAPNNVTRVDDIQDAHFLSTFTDKVVGGELAIAYYNLCCQAAERGNVRVNIEEMLTPGEKGFIFLNRKNLNNTYLKGIDAFTVIKAAHSILESKGFTIDHTDSGGYRPAVIPGQAAARISFVIKWREEYDVWTARR